jgi:hypothetical protein
MLAAVDHDTPPSGDSLDQVAARSAWATNTAHLYGYSVSPEGGILAGVTAEMAPRALGSSASTNAFTADARAYLPGFASHHVIAVRGAGGVSTGDPDLRRTFLLGGAAPAPSTISFDADAISLLRGFPANTFAGSHVALINADYRFPLARPQRGHGTWPFFVHTLHGAVFADAGQAWTGAFHADALKTSVGGEISAQTVVGFFAPLTITGGAAWGHDGSHTVADRMTYYARVGYAF